MLTTDRLAEIDNRIAYLQQKSLEPGANEFAINNALDKAAREKIAVEIALDKAVKSYDSQEMSPRLWMDREEAQARGFSDYRNATRRGDGIDEVRVDRDQFLLGPSAGAREVQRAADAAQAERSYRDSVELRDFADRAASGQLTGPELERYIRQVERSRFQERPW